MITFVFRYRLFNQESLEDGDFLDSGYYSDGIHYSMNSPAVQKDYRENPHLYEVNWKPGDLKAIINTAKNLGIFNNSGFLQSELQENYRTGEGIVYSLSIYGITPSTRRRIHRLLSDYLRLTNKL